MMAGQYIITVICMAITGYMFGKWHKSYWAGAFMTNILIWALYFIDKAIK
jgi:hypothetical protein